MSLNGLNADLGGMAATVCNANRITVKLVPTFGTVQYVVRI